MKKTNNNQQAQAIRKETIQYITKKCKGLISKKGVTSLIANLSDKEILDTRSYELIITSNAERASIILTLLDCTGAHSSAGNWGQKDKGSVIIGSCCFGTDYNYQYFDNGNPEDPINWIEKPQFDTTKTLAVLIESHEWDNYNGADKNYHRKKILIFLPLAAKKQVI